MKDIAAEMKETNWLAMQANKLAKEVSIAQHLGKMDILEKILESIFCFVLVQFAFGHSKLLSWKDFTNSSLALTIVDTHSS